MAKIGRTCKEYAVKELTGKIQGSPNIFVTDCAGLTVAEMGKLRTNLKPGKATYVVVKNSMGKLALKNAKTEDLLPYIEGTIGLVCGGADPILTSKALLSFSKESGKLKVKAGILDGKLIKEEDIKTLSLLPSREVLLSRMCGGMKAPITGFARVLNGTLSKFVYAINAIKQKKEGKEGGSN